MSLPAFWPRVKLTFRDGLPSVTPVTPPLLGLRDAWIKRTVFRHPPFGDRMSDVDYPGKNDECLEGTTLLVVEDEVRFSRVLQRFLKLSGISPIEALDGEQAIQILEQDEENLVDAVVTDLRMPVVSGWELIAVLRECRPYLPVVAMSAIPPSPVLPADVPLLSKPFLPEQLLETVAPLIQRSRQLRGQAREQRADAAGVRSEAFYQRIVADHQRAWSSDLRSALASYRASLREL